jgi:hypothetical protein
LSRKQETPYHGQLQEVRTAAHFIGSIAKLGSVDVKSKKSMQNPSTLFIKSRFIGKK